jgi:hypothetical protein
MSRLLLALPLAVFACSSSDTDLDSDAEADPYGGCHPNVAEYLIEQGLDPLDPTENSLCDGFNTDTPCTRRNGSPGSRVYRISENGQADANGNFTATERWWWFYGDPDNYEQDAVDTLTYSGSLQENFSDPQICVGCEEFYILDRTETDNQTGTPYAQRIMFAMDNLNEFNDGLQEDNNMFVFYARFNAERNRWTDLNDEYARGKYYPEGDVPGALPAEYTWGPYNASGACL